MRIYVAPGHGVMPSGTFDPGAVSGHEVEHTLARAVVTAYASALRRNGITVVEETEPDPDYIGSVARANAAGVDCGDEVHFNAGGGHGVEVEVHPNTTAANRACAVRMCQLIAAATGLPNRGPVNRTGLYWLNATNFPALLPEIAFVDADQAVIDRPGFAVTVGEALARARCEYAGLPYAPPGTAPPPPTAPALSVCQDAAYPQGVPVQPGVIISAGYIGGNPYHQWEAADWAAWPTPYRVPIWKRSNPETVSPVDDANSCLAALRALGAPEPYLVLPYGSKSTLFGNPQLDGYWVADYTGTRHLYAHAGVVATQYLNNNAAGYDLSVILQSVPTWDVASGTGPTAVMLDLETASNPDWVTTFGALLRVPGKVSTGIVITTINGTFVAAEATSPDGAVWTRSEDWTEPASPPAGAVDAGTVVTTINGQFVAANASSADGATWQRYEDFA